MNPTAKQWVDRTYKMIQEWEETCPWRDGSSDGLLDPPGGDYPEALEEFESRIDQFNRHTDRSMRWKTEISQAATDRLATAAGLNVPARILKQIHAKLKALTTESLFPDEEVSHKSREAWERLRKKAGSV